MISNNYPLKIIEQFYLTYREDSDKTTNSNEEVFHIPLNPSLDPHHQM